MRVLDVISAEQQGDAWHVTQAEWSADIKPGQFLEQVRGSEGTAVAIWKVVALPGDGVVLEPASGPKEILPGDGMDSCIGLGLGDAVAWVTSSLGIQPCESCKKRQERLNKFLPFRKP